jgi:hypothetical protein
VIASPARARAARAVIAMTLLASVALAAPATTTKPATAKPATTTKTGTTHAPSGAKTAAKAPAKPAVRDTRAPAQIAHDAIDFEDQSLYQRALEQWRALRPRVPADGDLELATAIDEARCGLLDSAAARLATPMMDAAVNDTLPMDRYKRYGSQRDPVYIDGRFDGWHWYVWRARAEVALAQRRWDAAAAAARQATAALPFSAEDWLLLAIAEGRAGHDTAAADAAHHAATLDPVLPEALYLDGLWAWRAGRRNEAQNAFRAAVTADRAFEPAGLALVRSRLPGSPPDSLPGRFLTGRREAAMITSPVGPKIEQFIQLERSVAIMTKLDPVVPDSLKKGLFGLQLPLWVLVDEEGHCVISEIGWIKPGAVAPSVLADLTEKLRYWTFSPAQLHGAPHAVWVDILYQFAL